MTIKEYIGSTTIERRGLLNNIHELIINNDKTVEPLIKTLMGKESILYEQRGYMKYGLVSVKNHISLHCLPMYMDPAIHVKYSALMPAANFQKGVINFPDDITLPLNEIKLLFTECAKIDIAEVLANRKKKSK